MGLISWTRSTFGYGAFSHFSQATRHGNRYIHGEKVTLFLDNVLATSKEREIMFEKGLFFWRAQLGHDWRLIYKDHRNETMQACPHPQKRMIQTLLLRGEPIPREFHICILQTKANEVYVQVEEITPHDYRRK